MKPDLLELLGSLLEVVSFSKFDDASVLVAEKKALLAGVDAFVSGGVSESDWRRFLATKWKSKLASSGVRYCEIVSEKGDIESLRRLRHFLRIDASADEIMSCIEAGCPGPSDSLEAS